SLKAQIREATNEAVALAQKFGEFSPEAIKAAERVALLKDQMQDFQQKLQALNPDKFEAIGKIVGGVASGISAAEGAMALFGAESEDVQKALLKVQGAMALAQGIQGVIDAQKQFKAFGQVALSAFQSMTTASKVFLATGLGLLLAGLGAVVAYWEDISVALGLAKSEMDKMNAAMKVAAGMTKQQATDLEYYNSVVQNTKKSEAERIGALAKLKEAGIATDDVNIANANSLGRLNDRTKTQVLLIAQKARTEAAAQILQEKTKKLLEMQNGNLDDQITLWDRFAEASKAAITGGLYQQDLQTRASNNVKKAQEEVNKATAVYNAERNKQLSIDGQVIKTSQDVKSTLDKQKEAQKELNKEHEKRTTKTIHRERQLILNTKNSDDFDKQIKEKQQKREQVNLEIKVEKALEWLEESKKNAQAEIELEQRKQDAIQAARLNG
ncbi:MAG: hypothetical protein EBU52_21580, partial [Cytophagia bacterium]|nr:hypothetical protein [Cytophagia bacterium]